MYQPEVAGAKLDGLQVDVGETTIVTLMLKQPLQIAGSVERSRCYASGGTAVKSTEAGKGFEVALRQPQTLSRVKLKVGVYKEGGIKQVLQGTFNGQPFKIEPRWASEFKFAFGTLEIDVPPAWLKNKNQIKLDPIEGLTITSVHLLTDRVTMND